LRALFSCGKVFGVDRLNDGTADGLTSFRKTGKTLSSDPIEFIRGMLVDDMMGENNEATARGVRTYHYLGLCAVFAGTHLRSICAR
jgi:hypothetical protein